MDGQPWLPARPNLPSLPAFLTAFHTDPLPRVRPLREQLPVQVDILRRVVGVVHLPHRGRVWVGHHQAPLWQDGRSRHRRGTPHERRRREINRVQALQLWDVVGVGVPGGEGHGDRRLGVEGGLQTPHPVLGFPRQVLLTRHQARHLHQRLQVLESPKLKKKQSQMVPSS